MKPETVIENCQKDADDHVPSSLEKVKENPFLYILLIPNERDKQCDRQIKVFLLSLAV